MDKKSKIFFIAIAVLLIGSVSATYWRVVVKKDYLIEAQTDCDPYTDKCFVWECDLESVEDGEACTGDADEDIWYFQVIQRKASQIPLCDPNDEECEALVCGEDEPECGYIFCTDDALEDQYANYCSDPVEYTAENPEEEECDPETDEDCVFEEDAVEADTIEEVMTSEDTVVDESIDDAIAVDEIIVIEPCDASTGACLSN